MGGGSWTKASYVTHSTVNRGFTNMDSFKSASTQELYKSRGMNDALNPYKVVRECCDSEEHPETVPVILALDVTGSMGSAASAIATQLGDIMDKLYGEVKDVEFLTMAIGDMSYDIAPVQASQFESDIRIAEQIEKIYFEGHGGGNSWESYTAAWYFGLYHTKLDCWKRGKKGIIITLGDEMLNPYLPAEKIHSVFGDNVQSDIETKNLYQDVIKKFDVYHIAVNDRRTSFRLYEDKINNSFGKIMGQNLIISDCENLYNVISDIVKNSANDATENSGSQNNGNMISW